MLLRTLGELSLEGSDFSRPKPLLLLAYLALEGPKPRRYLAELFFMDTKDPFNSLSRALSHLRKETPGAVAADSTKARAILECDAVEFLGLANNRRFDKCIPLYRGPFVESLDIELGPELEEWVYARREHLAWHIQQALLELAEVDAGLGNFKHAADKTERAYLLAEAPPPEPEDLGRYYALLAVGESAYASKVRREAEDYGLTLPPSTERVKARLSPLFAGRERELGRLKELEPDHWAWVKGGTGIGKTSLLKRLPGTYLVGRSGLPYATLEPLLDETSYGSPEAVVQTLLGKGVDLLIDGWEFTDPDSRNILERLRALKPKVRVIISSSGDPSFDVDTFIELKPLNKEALAAHADAWEKTGGVPRLVDAHLRGEPLGYALEITLSHLTKNERETYLSLALLDGPDVISVRRALGLDAVTMARSLEALYEAGLASFSGKVWPRLLAREYLNAHPALLSQLALKLAQFQHGVNAFLLYQASKPLWSEEDLPKVQKAYLTWSSEVLKRGFPNRVIEILNEVPLDAPLSLLKARALEQAGLYKDALAALQGVPESDEMLLLKASLLWRRGVYKTSFDMASRLSHADDFSVRAESLHILGLLAWSEGEFALAEQQFTRSAALWQALGVKDRWANALVNVAGLKIEAKQPLDAINRTFDEASHIASGNMLLQTRIALNQATAFERYGNTEKAAELLQHTAQLAQTIGQKEIEARAWSNLGAIYHRKAMVEQAKNAYNHAFVLAQDVGEIRLLGIVMTNLAELTGNREAWEEGLHILEKGGHHAMAQRFREELPFDKLVKAE